MELPKMKALMKQNKIRGYSVMNKAEIKELLKERGLILEEKEVIDAPRVELTVNNPKYEHLKDIRNNPKRVEIRDLETGDVNIYSSIYKASRGLRHSPTVITDNAGKVWKGRYAIEIV